MTNIVTTFRTVPLPGLEGWEVITPNGDRIALCGNAETATTVAQGLNAMLTAYLAQFKDLRAEV